MFACFFRNLQYVPEVRDRGLSRRDYILWRRIHGCNREEVTGRWRKFRNEELHDLYSSANIT
jgi:hypothetical protein